MIELYDATYIMEMRGGGDIWRLTGKSTNHPKFPGVQPVWPSTPIEFNEETDEMTTASGSKYKIISYLNKAKTVAQIKSDVLRRGYEVH